VHNGNKTTKADNYHAALYHTLTLKYAIIQRGSCGVKLVVRHKTNGETLTMQASKKPTEQKDHYLLFIHSQTVITLTTSQKNVISSFKIFSVTTKKNTHNPLI